METKLTTEGLMARADNRYRLVILAFKRAAELNSGAAKLVSSDSKKVTTLALEEIKEGKVFIKDDKDKKKE